MYSTEALERGIEQCKKNIKVFEEAIDKERDTIKQYHKMIDAILEREKIEKEKANHIDIVIERDGDSQH